MVGDRNATGPEDMAFVQSLRGGSVGAPRTEVFGTPLHLTPGALAARFEADGLEAFLAHEARQVAIGRAG